MFALEFAAEDVACAEVVVPLGVGQLFQAVLLRFAALLDADILDLDAHHVQGLLTGALVDSLVDEDIQGHKGPPPRLFRGNIHALIEPVIVQIHEVVIDMVYPQEDLQIISDPGGYFESVKGRCDEAPIESVELVHREHHHEVLQLRAVGKGLFEIGSFHGGGAPFCVRNSPSKFSAIESRRRPPMADSL